MVLNHRIGIFPAKETSFTRFDLYNSPMDITELNQGLKKILPKQSFSGTLNEFMEVTTKITGLNDPEKLGELLRLFGELSHLVVGCISEGFLELEQAARTGKLGHAFGDGHDFARHGALSTELVKEHVDSISSNSFPHDVSRLGILFSRFLLPKEIAPTDLLGEDVQQD
jgi:hypothetical protein